MKQLDPSDFRAFRLVLEPDDFALGSDQPDPPPSDLVDKETWESMVSLPDDVSVRTSNYFGSTLAKLWSYWDQWNCLNGALQATVAAATHCPMAQVACDVADDLQASIFCALTGYYRAAFSCLRNVVEQMPIALQLELSGDAALFQGWLSGSQELRLRWAADSLPNHGQVATLETHLRNAVGDDLFSQKRSAQPGGFVRRVFSELSKFTHGAPGLTDSDLRKSTGPVFVSEIFEKWATKFRQTYAVGVLEARIAKPQIRRLAYGSKLTSRELFESVVAKLPSNADGTKLLAAAVTNVW